MENGFVHEADPWSNRPFHGLLPQALTVQASNFCQASMRGIKIGSVAFMNIVAPLAWL